MIMRTKSWLLCLVAIFCACGSQDADRGVERKLPSVKEEQRKAIEKAIPMAISEAEPIRR